MVGSCCSVTQVSIEAIVDVLIPRWTMADYFLEKYKERLDLNVPLLTSGRGKKQKHHYLLFAKVLPDIRLGVRDTARVSELGCDEMTGSARPVQEEARTQRDRGDDRTRQLPDLPALRCPALTGLTTLIPDKFISGQANADHPRQYLHGA